MKKKKGRALHAEEAALLALPRRGDLLVILVARKTLEGVSRPCSRCLTAIHDHPARKKIIVFHAANKLWLESL